MSFNLHNKLIKETDEEIAILQRDKQVKKNLYTDQRDFVIESEKFLSNDNMIMVRKHTRFVDFPKHKHDYIEFNYVYNGMLKQKVGNEKIELKKGELLFLNQHIEHEIEACQREDIVINFIIQPHYFEYIFSYLSSESIGNKISDFLIDVLFDQTQTGRFLYFAVADIESIQELIQKIIIEIMKPSILSESTIKLYMGLLMIELVKNSDKIKGQNEGSHQYQLIMESLRYIEEQYKVATLSELANKLNQPSYALSKSIKRSTNYTFKELLREKRLRKAKELLKNTNLPIATIVEQVGYENISYFYRIFKKKYGITPKMVRSI